MPIYGRSSNAITKHGKKQENYDATQQKKMFSWQFTLWLVNLNDSVCEIKLRSINN